MLYRTLIIQIGVNLEQIFVRNLNEPSDKIRGNSEATPKRFVPDMSLPKDARPPPKHHLNAEVSTMKGRKKATFWRSVFLNLFSGQALADGSRPLSPATGSWASLDWQSVGHLYAAISQKNALRATFMNKTGLPICAYPNSAARRDRVQPRTSGSPFDAATLPGWVSALTTHIAGQFCLQGGVH
jgi:hypothetical protein